MLSDSGTPQSMDVPLSMSKVHIAKLAMVTALGYGVIALPILVQQPLATNMAMAPLILAAALSLLTAIDMMSRRLPDVLTLPLLLAGIGLAGVNGPEELVWHAASALLGGLSLYAVGWLYYHYRGFDGLGLGDVKLFAAAGAWTGAEGLATVLLIACGSALIATLVLRQVDGSINGQSAIPFGPFLALGLWVVWLYGPLA